MIGALYAGKTPIPYTKVTSIHYQILKKDALWKIGVNNLSVCSLKDWQLFIIDERDGSWSKNEDFYNPTNKKVFTATIVMPLQFLRAGFHARHI